MNETQINIVAALVFLFLAALVLLAKMIGLIARRVWNLEFDYLERNRKTIPDFYQRNEDLKKLEKKK